MGEVRLNGGKLCQQSPGRRFADRKVVIFGLEGLLMGREADTHTEPHADQPVEHGQLSFLQGIGAVIAGHQLCRRG